MTTYKLNNLNKMHILNDLTRRVNALETINIKFCLTVATKATVVRQLNGQPHWCVCLLVANTHTTSTNRVRFSVRSGFNYRRFSLSNKFIDVIVRASFFQHCSDCSTPRAHTRRGQKPYSLCVCVSYNLPTYLFLTRQFASGILNSYSLVLLCIN